MFWLMLEMFFAEITRDMNINVVISAVKGRQYSLQVPLCNPKQMYVMDIYTALKTPLVVDFRCLPEAQEHEY